VKRVQVFNGGSRKYTGFYSEADKVVYYEFMDGFTAEFFHR
jgi:hypothetical protein